MTLRAKIFFGIVASLIALASNVAWHQHRAARELEAALVAAKAQPQVKARPTAVENVPADVATERRNRERVETQAPPAAAPAPAPGPRELLHDDPALQLLWLAARRAAITSDHGPLFKSLGLTPAQIERFQAIALRREEQAMDLSALMRERGLTFADSAIAALRQQADDAERAAHQELLGAEGVQRLHEYGRALPARELVSGLAGAAAVSGVSFSAEQAEQLTQVLARASARYRTGGSATLADIDWDLAERDARAILTDAQFTLYQTVEPEGRGARFSSQAASVIARAREAEASK